ncbi:unnamed protein product [[Candida] boidinii]|nr:unnamed protein product [[Candida] boidinii]
MNCEKWNQVKVDKLKEAVDTARDSLFLIKLKKNENVESGEDESESVSLKSVSPSPTPSPNTSLSAATTTPISRPTGFGGVVFGASTIASASINAGAGITASAGSSSSSSSNTVARSPSSLSTQVTFGVDHQDAIDNDESAILED